MKRIWISALSVLLLYGGVAWAIGACLQDHRPWDHVSAERHSNPEVLEGGGESPASVIHCPPLSRQVGPAVRVVSTEFSRSDKGVSLYTHPLQGALPTALESGLRLEALFKTFPPPTGFARHLLLSVFRI